MTGGESTLIPKHLPENVRIQVARSLLSREPGALPENSGTEVRRLTWEAFRKETIANADKQYLSNLLRLSGNDIRTAMEYSGLSRSRLYEIKKYRITFPS